MKTIFAIFGNPVKHSKSPLMHNCAFKALEAEGCYTRYLLPDGEKLRNRFFELGLKGANITVPHKEYAYEACDSLDSFAEKAGAVNTIVERDGLLHGYNTDAPGFLKAVKSFSGIKRVLFLGAGGTAQSTAIILRDSGYDITILNRSAQRLEFFAKNGFAAYTYDALPLLEYDLIVNMTSAGLDNDALPAPQKLLKSIIPTAKACIDVIYGKKTPFLKLSESLGKPTMDGSSMLLFQGVLAFDIFTGGRYRVDEIEKAMKRAFEI